MKKYSQRKNHLLFLNFHSGGHDKSQAHTPHNNSIVMSVMPTVCFSPPSLIFSSMVTFQIAV